MSKSSLTSAVRADVPVVTPSTSPPLPPLTPRPNRSPSTLSHNDQSQQLRSAGRGNALVGHEQVVEVGAKLARLFDVGVDLAASACGLSASADLGATRRTAAAASPGSPSAAMALRNNDSLGSRR